MNKNILKHFVDGNIICHNCNVKVKIELKPENEKTYYNKNFHCDCKSIDCFVNDDNIRCWLSFKHKNIAYDLNYKFNDNETEATIYDSGERDDDGKRIVINNFCPFECNVGKIINTINSYCILQ